MISAFEKEQDSDYCELITENFGIKIFNEL